MQGTIIFRKSGRCHSCITSIIFTLVYSTIIDFTIILSCIKGISVHRCSQSVLCVNISEIQSKEMTTFLSQSNHYLSYHDTQNDFYSNHNCIVDLCVGYIAGLS